MPIDRVVYLGADVWGWANNQPGITPPPNTDVDYIVFTEDAWWGPPNGAGPYNGWGQYGTNSGNNVIYGLTVKSSGYNLGEYRGLTYNYDNNSSGGFLSTMKVTNNLMPPSPPFFYDNTMQVTVQMWDYTFTYLYAGHTSVVNFGSSSGVVNITDPNSPILNNVYWRVIIANGFSDPNTNVDVTINGALYVTGYNLPQYNSNLTLDWYTYGSSTVGNTGLGFTGATFEVIFN